MLHYPIKRGLVLVCLCSILSLTFITSAHREEGRVTEASLTADNAQVSGPCPLRVVFNGYITMNGPGTVRYTFARSDGATGPIQEMEFRQAGRQAVSIAWTLGDASALPHFEGWQALRILSPNSFESGRATFTIDCREPGLTVVSPGQRIPLNPTVEPTPTPSPTPPPCQLYGERGVASDGTPSVSGCCTTDTSITSLQSGFCEGISPDLPGNSTLRRGSETTIAFVPAWTDTGGAHGARLVMGFNGAGPTGFLNWSISTDQGRTWSDRNRGNGGPGGNAVDNPTTAFNSYRGDLSVVALPSISGGVAMVSLGDLVPCPSGCLPNLVVLLVSIDGGQTFTKTSIVNDRLGVGITDQPRVTVDPGDGTIWVMWRAGRPPFTPYYTYVRGGHLGASGSVDWDINGDGQLVQSNPVVTTLDYQHPRFKVFTRPGARTHTVAVTGPQAAPMTTFLASGRCAPGAGFIRNSFWQYPLGVFFTVSENDGRQWTDLHSAVDMQQPFALGCVGGVGGRDATGQLIYSENRIDLARDSRNGNYLVTRASVVSDPTNAFIGQRVEVWRRSTTPNASFRRVISAPWTSANPWQFNPSVAARDDGQIAVSYYQTTGSTQTVELMVMGSLDGGNTWSPPVQLSRNSPWPATDRSLGEYDEIVALPESVLSPRMRDPNSRFWPGAFYASWSNGVGRVFAAGYTPPAP